MRGEFLDKKKGREFLHLPCAKVRVSDSRTERIVMFKKALYMFLNKSEINFLDKKNVWDYPTKILDNN